MATSAHPQPLSGISSQAGLATLRPALSTPSAPVLLELIDAYATARAERDRASFGAEWAFLTAHAAMLNARARVAAALGIATPPALTDELTQLATSCVQRANGGDR